jgi:hypothetical protein
MVDAVCTSPLTTTIPPPENPGITDFLYFLNKRKKMLSPDFGVFRGETGGFDSYHSTLTSTIPLPSGGDTPFGRQYNPGSPTILRV